VSLVKLLLRYLAAEWRKQSSCISKSWSWISNWRQSEWFCFL